MQPLTQAGFTRQQVIDALHAPVRTTAFRYELLDADNVGQGDLDTVTGGQVDNNTLADIKRTAKFDVDETGEVDWLSDRIRPWMRLKMPDGTWLEWPQGVFLLSSPTRRVTAEGRQVRQVEAYSQSVVLHDDKVADRYVVDAGTNYIDAVSTLLTAAGIDQQNLSATANVVPVDRSWAPGTSYLAIIRDLLAAINYRSLSFSPSGAAVAKPYQPPSERAVGYTYAADQHSLLSPEADVDFDLFGIPNRWVLTVSEPDTPELTSTYTNDNPASPTSTVSRGRTIVRHEKVEAADQAALDAKAQRLAFEASQVYEAVEVTTALMPHHEDNDVIELDYPAVGARRSYTEHKWTLPLRSGGQMKHTIRRVVDI